MQKILYELALVRASGRRKSDRREWIGLKAHFHGLETREDLELHIGGAGYVGISKVENERTNVSGLFKLNKSCKGQKLELLLSYIQASGLTALADRLRSVEADEDSFCGVTALDFKRYLNSPSEFCLGDAQGMICPFTGNGMSIALESAELATAPLIEFSKGETSWSKAIREYNHMASRKFAGRLHASTQLHPFIYRKPFNQLSEGLVKLNLIRLLMTEIILKLRLVMSLLEIAIRFMSTIKTYQVILMLEKKY